MDRSRRIIGAVAACLILLMCASGSRGAIASSAAQLSRPESAARTNLNQPGRAQQDEPQRLWMVESLDTFADRSEVAIGDLIYVNTTNGLLALDPTTGVARWRAGQAELYTLRFDAASNVVFTLDKMTGSITGFDGASGAQLWAGSTTEHSSPAAAGGGTLYTMSGDPGALHALDATSGEERWRYPTEPVTKIDLITAETVFATPLYFDGADNSKTVALDTASGAERWATAVEDGPAHVLAATDDLVLIGRETLIARDVATGEERWTSPIGSFAASAVIAGGFVYVGTEAGIAAIDLATGSTVWQRPGEFSGSVAAVEQGTVYGEIDDATVALNAATGDENWRTDLAQPTVGIVADGIVYVGTTNPGLELTGTATALAAPTGQVLWQVDAGLLTQVIGIVSGVVITLERGGIVSGIGVETATEGAAIPIPVASSATAASASTGTDYLGRAGAVQAGPGPDSTPSELWDLELSELDAYATGDGVIYVGTRDGGVALDLVTGQERWRASIGRVTSIVLDGNDLFVGTRVNPDRGTGGLTALDATSGEVRWTVPDQEAEIVVLQVVDGRVFGLDTRVWDGPDIVAWDAATGRESWRFAREGAPNRTVNLITDGVAYLGCDPASLGDCDVDTIVALDTATGQVIWETETGTAAVVGADDGLIFAIDDFGLFRGLDRTDGKIVTQIRPDEIVDFYGVVDGIAYSNYRHDLVEWDANTGAELRRAENLDVGWVDGLTDDRLYASADVDEGSVVIAIDRSTLRPIWQFPAQGGLSDPEVVALTNDTVYVVDGSDLYAVDSETGQERWHVSMTLAAFYEIEDVVISNGIVLVTAGDPMTAGGRLTALGEQD